MRSDSLGWPGCALSRDGESCRARGNSCNGIDFLAIVAADKVLDGVLKGLQEGKGCRIKIHPEYMERAACNALLAAEPACQDCSMQPKAGKVGRRAVACAHV